MKKLSHIFGITLLLALLTPNISHACACGCGIFDVGTSSMLPSSAGGMASLNYAYSDQTKNWHGSSKAPADSNDDKEVRTHFITLGLQYMFNRSWGLVAEVPYVSRYFKAANDSGEILSYTYGGIGDIRIRGLYTGFSENMSAGVSLGLKLPTASHTQSSTAVDIDRDTQIGSGSTDILAGGFYRHALIQGNSWSWFAQVELDQPVLSQDGYKPGTELDESFGIHYNNLTLGKVGIKPLAQIIGSERGKDSGPNSANPVASGYQRVLLSPGVELHIHPVKFYADIEFPVYENVTGNQLVSPVLFKVSLSSMF